MVKEIQKEEFFDADFRKIPKTNLYCSYCQRDLNIKKLKYLAFLSFDDAPTIFNPLYVTEFSKSRTIEIFPIGSECAKHIRKDWLIKINNDN